MKSNRVISRDEARALHLNDRIKLEREITDSMDGQKAKPVEIESDWKFEHYSQQKPHRHWMFDYLGPLDGKTILDLGCGFHATPIFFALGGARKVVATEVSPKALKYISEMADKFGVAERVETQLCPAEHMPFADDYFDLIHGCAVLHHLDIPAAGRELSRVLKHGGRAAFVDPLGHNPVLEYARDYLGYSWKHVQKGTDHPLTFDDIRKFGEHFDGCSFRGFDLLYLLALYLQGRGDSPFKRFTSAVDDRLLSLVPALQRFCRRVVTCVEKR